MGRARWLAGLVAGLLAIGQTGAAEPDGDSVVRQAQEKKAELPKTVPPAKDLPKTKEPPKVTPPPSRGPDPDVLARISDTGGEAPAGSFSRMMGDWVGAYYADQFVQLPGYQVTTTILTTPVFTRGIGPNGEPILIRTDVPIGTTTTATPTLVSTRARVPVLNRGGFKIAENERVVPEDRVFLTYNFYRHVAGPSGLFEPDIGLVGGTSVVGVPSPAAGPRQVVGLVGANPTLTQTFVPPTHWDVHRAVIGFEKTFFDGGASFGVRAPFYNVQGDGSLTGSDFGDLCFVFKGLLYNCGGEAASAGLVVTVPTGPDIPTVVGDIHSTLFQPFVAGLVSAGDVFAMGFASLVIPTDSRDVTLLFTDVGAGILVYQSPDGTWVAPTAEVHVTTPLNHRNGNGVLSVPDLVVLTQGVQCGLGNGTSLAVGVAVPITGPRPFDWEALVQLNFRY
jgi:hypothetical protein